MMAEVWLPVPGYEGMYDVSDQGRVRSLDRTILCRPNKANGAPYMMSVKGKILSPVLNTGGYPMASLARSDRLRKMPVHVAVLLAFVGARPDGLVTRHLNGNRQDNRLENLAYGTQSENIQDAVSQGTHRNTKKTHCSRGGHELAGDNLIILAGGNRTCRTCGLELARGRWARRQERDAS
jgi:hypothetical protein